MMHEAVAKRRSADRLCQNNGYYHACAGLHLPRLGDANRCDRCGVTHADISREDALKSCCPQAAIPDGLELVVFRSDFYSHHWLQVATPSVTAILAAKCEAVL